MITLFLMIVNRAKKCRRTALFFDHSLFFSTSAGVIFEILRTSSLFISRYTSIIAQYSATYVYHLYEMLMQQATFATNEG